MLQEAAPSPRVCGRVLWGVDVKNLQQQRTRSSHFQVEADGTQSVASHYQVARQHGGYTMGVRL